MSTSEVSRLDKNLAPFILENDRRQIWESAQAILNSHQNNVQQSTLALGYVQSGKTTSISALCALAADEGYRVIVAILGSTNLLLDQNARRIELSLGFEEHNYTWISQTAIKGKESTKDIQNWLEKGRVVFIPVIKNSKQLLKVADCLKGLDAKFIEKTLIIDDEADQASLNTRPDKDSPSSTYAAIRELRLSLISALYVQYTATPYAPLLVDSNDPLMPSAVEFLKPGTGYTGGREFLIEAASTVIRPIPFTDEAGTQPIASLPKSLERALAAFIAGAANLYVLDASSPPISMLVHATHRNDGQARYHFLIERFLEKAKASSDLASEKLGELIWEEYQRLIDEGVEDIGSEAFWKSVDLVLKELTLWLINSATDVKKVAWNYSPFHILIGGNKLDRGFTVEGLTVSYMNRKASEQIDTLEQRARAFGYRRSLLPYCQVFATPRTIRLLQGIVHTEDDLRANLYDWIQEGGLIADWAKSVGLDLPTGAKATRSNVIASIRSFNANADWHSLRRPRLDSAARLHNQKIVESSGLLQAGYENYGRLNFRTLSMSLEDLQSQVLIPWVLDDLSPSWRHEEILDHLRRNPHQARNATVVLMTRGDEDLVPRERGWVDDLGFVNLFQGRDNVGTKPPAYTGDRETGTKFNDPHHVVLQIHYVQRKGFKEDPLYTLAIHLGDRQVVRVREGM